jgi:hypothetical protein
MVSEGALGASHEDGVTCGRKVGKGRGKKEEDREEGGK